MPPFFFNDLSLGDWIASAEDLKEKLRELCVFHSSVRSHGRPVYLDRNGLYDSHVCGRSFRDAVRAYCDREQRRQVLGLIDKSALSLPENSAIPEGCRFLYEGKGIPRTGLAECAYWNFMGDGGQTYSLSGSGFSRTALPVTLVTEYEQRCLLVGNFHSLASLATCLDEQTPPSANWAELVAQAGRLEYLRFEPYVVSAELQREPFSGPIVEAVSRRLAALNEMAGSESGEAFLELERKYCHGENAWFHDESETRINQLRNKLTFNVQGRSTLCQFHAVISAGAFRIHLDSRPKRGRKITVVYIGRKIL